ncbi:gliding motility protein GldM [Robertkochia marina]|uniref:Gliding motility protein GldM n=1 Tax=Robertkochia marina TaxID=1227945 RepID=A0A4S3M161_9FLAO|nr:gliding motility protein GldM [Robertkochia marina]THD68812.1 gliding motility protein GldM [Robertkochia marina]TRZ43886.1 gliding motility protein GldM [Robertkochia marina]
MAGGNLSPRQKMINLMYLVFIAMLALNMSKEVLSAFGLLNEKLEASNTKATQNNLMAYEGLKQKAADQPEKYAGMLEEYNGVNSMSDEFYAYIDGIKTKITERVDPDDLESGNYEVMDKADELDQMFFQGDNYSQEGKKFVDYINEYREQALTTVKSIPDTLINATQKESLLATISDRFYTGDENGEVERKSDQKMQPWLNYHYEGFPLIASLTKLTNLQSDIKTTQEDILSSMVAGQMASDVSYSNYSTLLETPKSAYYSGEEFDGAIVLGRVDATTVPDRAELTLDGRELKEGEDYKFENGQVKMMVNAGRPGDHTLEGTLIFKEDGQEIEVPVSQTFATISKPNGAVISADKMNVVYRGVTNPLTISIPGIPDNKVNASAPGLSRVSGSKYAMKPGTGRTVKITASGVLPTGDRVGSSTEFRIKDIPRPSGTVRGEFGEIKMPRANLEISTIGAMLEDFDFDLNIAVSGFKFKVPGQPTVQVNGNKLDGRAKAALKRADRGEAVQIFDIEAYITNNRSYKLKKVSPVVVELTN